MTMTTHEAGIVANTIRTQIGWAGFATLGASDLAYTEDAGRAGLTFRARILPFKANGERGSSPRVMRVTILLDFSDTYNLTVSYVSGRKEITHVALDMVYADQLPGLMVALDFDGETALNPRYL